MNAKRLIEVDFTDEEIMQLARILEGELRRGAEWTFWAMIGVGFLAAFAGRYAALATAAANPTGANFIAALVLAGFFVGLWSPSIWLAAARKRALRSQSPPTALLIAEGGVCVRRAGERCFYARSAIAGLAAERGLALIRLRAGRPIAVPVRLIDAETWARLKALALTGP